MTKTFCDICGKAAVAPYDHEHRQHLLDHASGKVRRFAEVSVRFRSVDTTENNQYLTSGGVDLCAICATDLAVEMAHKILAEHANQQ